MPVAQDSVGSRHAFKTHANRTGIPSGENYVAGVAALNDLLRAPRVSRGVDLFRDTEQAPNGTCP